MSILQDIFRDHYEIIEYTCHPREVELENIDKMIHCGDVRPDRTEVEVDERRTDEGTTSQG